MHPHGPNDIANRVDHLLDGLLRISNLVGSVMMLDDILDQITRITAELMQVPICSIYLLDEDGRRLVLRSNVGFDAAILGRAGFDWGEGIPGWVARHGEVVALANANDDPRYKPMHATLETDVHAYICAPLRIQEEIIGVMTARKHEVYAYTERDVHFFETVCKQVAIVIEKSRMYSEKIQAERLAAVAISLTGVAHYIKNIFLAMQGGEYMVEEGLEQDKLQQAREGWRVLKRANEKIRGLVENMLNYCSQDAIRLREVDLNGLVRQLVEDVAESARERGIEVTGETDSRLLSAWIDPESLYDALLNLVTNAVDAIPGGRVGHVQVRTELLDGRHQYLIEVIDDGEGIPPEIEEKIFTLFFSTKGRQGTGIGLAATRKIVEAHGGAIELETTPGQGSRFSLYMPVRTIEVED